MENERTATARLRVEIRASDACANFRRWLKLVSSSSGRDRERERACAHKRAAVAAGELRAERRERLLRAAILLLFRN